MRLIAVGACYLDTILTVTHFPTEDSKLRASNLVRRRGGNTPNTLEVLSQLLDKPSNANNPNSKDTKLDLCTVLPSPDSAATQQILDSLGHQIRTSLCIHRRDKSEAPSSFVIQSQASSSRTIVNYNALPEMSIEEFRSKVEENVPIDEEVWVHFEGRNTDVGIECIRYLRNRKFRELTVSVEVEKPGREGLEEMAGEADVVFYSRTWAQDKGFKSASECLTRQSSVAKNARLLICTWGEHGSASFDCRTSNITQQGAFDIAQKQIVDTNGAGDTFTAGILYAQAFDGRQWANNDQLKFANELAGRKILQDGFAQLGECIKDSWGL